MTEKLSDYRSSVEMLLVRKPVILQLLRFAAIGALNTAIDFVILNYITKSFGIYNGTALGLLNVVSFSAAVVQSYMWNKAWAFAQSSVSLWQNFYRLALVGGLGFFTILAVVVGSAYDATPKFYLSVFGIFILSQILFWTRFGLRFAANNGSQPVNNDVAQTAHLFTSFLLVSLVGLIINSVVVTIASAFIAPYLSGYVNPDVIKNVAKVFATAFSLVWNFLGYKLIVFKK